MEETLYILDHEEQQKTLQKLSLIEATEGGWTRKYCDPLTGDIWVLYYVRSEMHGGGFPVLRKGSLPENLSDRLSMAFASNREEDVIGLAWDLSSEYERWPEVLDWLEENSESLSTKAVGLFIRCLTVMMPLNRCTTLNKPYEEVEADYTHFLRLAERAKRLVSGA